MEIKLCGMRRLEDIEAANRVMPDYVGFVFAPSKRQVTREAAETMKGKLDPRIKAVGVFVDEDLGHIAELLEADIIDIAQLHGDETEEDIQYLQAVSGKPVWKAVKVRSIHDVLAWLDSRADMLLFDSGAGSGETFDWGILSKADREFFLAGGLNPENLRDAAERINPYGVDLSSGIETDGWKDADKMKRAVETAREMEEERK